MKIKILHIITNLPIGGAQDNTLLTVERLDKQLWDVTLLCGPGGAWMERAKNNQEIKLIVLDQLVRPIKLLSDIVAVYKIYKLLKVEKYDIVHTHSSKPGFLGRLAARLAGNSIVIHTIHGFPFNDFMNPVARWFFIFIERWMSRWTDKLITVSRLNLEKALALKLADPDKFINIYSGINFAKFNTGPASMDLRKHLDIPEHVHTIGMVGRLSRQKAPELFIEAIPTVLEKFSNCRFILVGDGELRSRIELLSAKLGIKSQVIMTGFQEDIKQYLSLLDVFVLSSLWEGLGRSLTEAMYMRCPIVATAVEGVPELVEDGITGKLVKPGSPQDLAEAIIYQLEHPQQAAKMGEAGRRRVEDIFDIDKMIADIDLLYQRLYKSSRKL